MAMRFKLIFSYSTPYSSPSALCSLMQPSFFLCKAYALYCAYVLNILHLPAQQKSRPEDSERLVMFSRHGGSIHQNQLYVFVKTSCL